MSEPESNHGKTKKQLDHDELLRIAIENHNNIYDARKKIRGRKPKYGTDQERSLAKKIQTIASNKKNKDENDILKEIRELKQILLDHIKSGGTIWKKNLVRRAEADAPLTANVISNNNRLLRQFKAEQEHNKIKKQLNKNPPELRRLLKKHRQEISDVQEEAGHPTPLDTVVSEVAYNKEHQPEGDEKADFADDFIELHDKNSELPDVDYKNILTNLKKRELGKKGLGITSSLTNFGKKVYKGAKDTASKVVHTATDVATKVITGNTGLPPNVKKILDKDGDQLITKIVIARNPVGSALITALSVASMGQFKKNLEASPYDKLFHLKLILTLHNGKKVALEKVERVSMTMNPKTEKGQEDMDVPFDKTITLNQLYHNAETRMGDKFYPYSARDNNCQNFVLNVLQGSGIGNEKEYEFIKQNTTSLFGDESFLRKLSNTITDVGARFNVLMQGGGLKSNSACGRGVVGGQRPLSRGRPRKGKGVQEGVYPPMLEQAQFSQLPPYLQNDAEAGDLRTGLAVKSDSSDSSSEEGGDIDFEDMEWGSFKKYFQNRPKKLRHLKTMEELAKYIHKHPDDFNAKTKHRANFYLNVLIHKK